MLGNPLRRGQRNGNVLVLSAVLMVPCCAILAFSLDVGYVYVEQAELQSGADAAARAAVTKMHDSTTVAVDAAQNFAELNCPNSGVVLQSSDVEFGAWDEEARAFVPGAGDSNAARVTLKRHANNGNPVSLFFAKVIGHDSIDLTAEAIAMAPMAGGAGFQFLIDDEMIDSDEEAIEDLAQSLGQPPEQIILDNDGDGFIDLPPGSVLELPTGQVGDEGLFDISSYSGSFPFQENTDYTTTDFIAEGTALESSLGTRQLQDIEWNSSNAPHSELRGSKLLDPTPGVDPVDSHSDIAALPDASRTHVSPVFDDDVSMAETDPSKYGAPAANLQGERRGLLAYKILSSRPNPAGGSYLPLLTIEVVDPSTIDVTSLTIGEGGSSSSVGKVFMVQ